MKKYCYPIFILFFLVINTLFAQRNLNIYSWGGEIPNSIIKQFENDTGIRIHSSTYDNNETLYTKLIAGANNYDIIMPSGYYVERMVKHNMLLKLDAKKLTNAKYISEFFKNPAYDPGNRYSMPIIWGATGIFYNKNYINLPPKSWKEFWNKKWHNKLLLLDDAREVFSIALLSLGFSPNDTNPLHIKLAFQKLLQLKNNIKIFASDGIKTLLIDEDLILGSIWNGDAQKSKLENKNINFLFPQDGFIIWVDSVAIPRNAKNVEEAYLWINYLLKPKVSAQLAIQEGHAITNFAGKKLLPKYIKNNPIVYPTKAILKNAVMQTDLPEDILEIYNNYWQEFKMSF